MGAIVPQPLQPLRLPPPTWERDAHGHLHYRRPWPWLCVYCHTVQKAGRDTCVNCSAPKPEPTPEAQP